MPKDLPGPTVPFNSIKLILPSTFKPPAMDTCAVPGSQAAAVMKLSPRQQIRRLLTLRDHSTSGGHHPLKKDLIRSLQAARARVWIRMSMMPIRRSSRPLSLFLGIRYSPTEAATSTAVTGNSDLQRSWLRPTAWVFAAKRTWLTQLPAFHQRIRPNSLCF